MKLSIAETVKKPAIEAAPLFLGCNLVRIVPEGELRLKIVEAEAYHQDDPASHSFRGVTPRTAPMFEAGGRLYVYFTYGMHYAVNIVVGKKGVGEAVLLRAGEPLTGIEIMQKNRGITDVRNLANGPGKLAKALGVTDTKLSGKLLNKSSIYIEPPTGPVEAAGIIAGPRIGITKSAEMPWRFYLKGNQFVSKL